MALRSAGSSSRILRNASSEAVKFPLERNRSAILRRIAPWSSGAMPSNASPIAWSAGFAWPEAAQLRPSWTKTRGSAT